MHTEMWQHPATAANVATLRSRGAIVLEPAIGRLTGADTGPGRLPDPREIFAACRSVLARVAQHGSVDTDLTGRRIVVSAGGTREPLDPVRYLGNRSSGLQGYALARAAALRGASVTLVAAHTDDLPDPAGTEVRRVSTARQLYRAVLDAAGDADAVVMAAAVADFRPAEYSDVKIKRPKADDGAAGPVVRLVQNPHVTRTLGTERVRAGQIVVGFAAETGDSGGSALDHGRGKLDRYGVDLLVVNEVGERLAFGTDDNAAVVLGADGSATEVPRGPKDALAHVILDLVAERLKPAV
jgi:phosphopantothenoylcysteine decarboxylase/phosphopantothenate--cysteine ligase